MADFPLETWSGRYSTSRFVDQPDRGNPDDRIAERKEKLVQAVEMRQAYWQRKEVRDQGQTLT